MNHDLRIDHLGLCGLITRKFADPLKEQIKAEMTTAGETRHAGNRYQGLLVLGTVQTVDPEKFLNAYAKGKITRKQFLAAIKVQRDAALDALGRDELAKISTEAPMTPSLRVTQVEKVEISLAEAVGAVAAAIAFMAPDAKRN